MGVGLQSGDKAVGAQRDDTPTDPPPATPATRRRSRTGPRGRTMRSTWQPSQRARFFQCRICRFADWAAPQRAVTGCEDLGLQKGQRRKGSDAVLLAVAEYRRQQLWPVVTY